MSKLLELMPWLTLENAALRLSKTAGSGEEWKASDLVRLAIDNHIRISAYLPEPLHGQRVEANTQVEDSQNVIVLGDGIGDVERLHGAWDIAPYGAGYRVLEGIYRALEGLPPSQSRMPSREGIYLHDPEQSTFYRALRLDLNFTFAREESSDEKGVSTPISRLSIVAKGGGTDTSLAQEVAKVLSDGLAGLDPVIEKRTHNFYLADRLPDDSILVIRTDEIAAFEERHFGGKIKATLSPTERESAHQMIAALTSLAGLDISKPYKAADALRLHADLQGIQLPSSNETVVKFLKPIGKAKMPTR
ncbi:hypothetical protein [Pseudomonas panipatensis]|uniref:hypothetical protein n=1 Tax=Pseudomonas panipatensis TaxID=428992 RepID=UPI0035B45CB6